MGKRKQLNWKSNKSLKKRAKTPEKGKPKEKDKDKKSKILKSKSGLDRLIKFAKEIQNCLKSKGTTKIAVKSKMTLKEARRVAETFYKAYNGDIPPLLINSETLSHLKHSKYLSGIDIAASYPSLFEDKGDAKNIPPLQPGIGPLIKLSGDKLKMTICKATPGFSIKIDSTSKKLISQRKFCIDNNSRKLVRTGYSSGLIIQDLKKLIREILFEDYQHDISQNSAMFTEIKELLTKTLHKVTKISKTSKIEENADDLNLLYGTLEVVASLFDIVQSGSEVNMNMNDKFYTGTVVDGSYYSGKLDLSVILEDESNLIKLSRNEAIEAKLFENNSTIEWRQELLPDISLVNQAIAACFKCVKEGVRNPNSRGDSMSLILTMLLKITLQYKDEEKEQLDNMQPLFQILDEYHSKAVEIPTEECKLELTEAWRRIVDKLEPVLNYHYTVEAKSETEKVKMNISIQQTDINIHEYSMPLSGYDQLPRPVIPANETKAAIRLLAYWEKNIIPKIIEFVKSTYKPWEMEFYFEQLRHSLRIGDQSKALEDAMVM